MYKKVVQTEEKEEYKKLFRRGKNTVGVNIFYWLGKKRRKLCCRSQNVLLAPLNSATYLYSMNGARWVHKSEKIRETLELEPFQNHIAIWISFSLLYSTVLCALLDFWMENRCDFFMFVALPCVAFVYTFKCISFVFQWVECLFVRCAQKQKYMTNS